MAQHYMPTGWSTESVCGFDMVGLRNPAVDTDVTKTDCIACKAINEDRPLYAVDVLDEDGYKQRLRFNTPREQLDYVEFAYDEGAVSVTLQILSVEDLRNGE
jgi:hypothetical protein